MAGSQVTLADLRLLAYRYADMDGTTQSDELCSVDEVNRYVNSALGAFNDNVVRLDVKFYLTSSLFTVPQGSNSFQLPQQYVNSTGNGSAPINFMTSMGLDRSGDGSGSPQSMFTVHRLKDWGARNAGHNSFWTPAFRPQVRYDILGNTITLFPALNAPGVYNLWWYPDAPTLVSDNDWVDGQRYWCDFIAVNAAIRMKQKQESDTTALENWQQQIISRMEIMGADRDFSEPRMTGRSDHGEDGWNGGDGSSGFNY